MAVKKKKRKSKGGGIGDRITDLMNFQEPTIITIYGRPGSGKTTFAGTLPKPLLLIDIEDKGVLSAKRKGLEEDEVKIISISEFDEIFELYDYIMDNSDDFASICIDHLTALQDLCNTKMMEEENKDQMSQRLYGLTASKMKQVINLYKNLTSEGILPCFICQDRTNDGEGEGEDQLIPEVGPALMPSVSRTLCAASRVIAHMYLFEKVNRKKDLQVTRKIEYRMRLGPNPYYITKVTRPPEIECPAFIVDPSYKTLDKIIKGEYENGKEKKKKRK